VTLGFLLNDAIDEAVLEVLSSLRLFFEAVNFRLLNFGGIEKGGGSISSINRVTLSSNVESFAFWKGILFFWQKSCATYKQSSSVSINSKFS
jgi:hypothetical protein